MIPHKALVAVNHAWPRFEIAAQEANREENVFRIDLGGKKITKMVETMLFLGWGGAVRGAAERRLHLWVQRFRRSRAA